MRPLLLSSIEQTARWAPVLLGLTIPVTVAGDALLLVISIVALGTLAAVRYREYLIALAKHPMTQRTALLFILLVLGALYGDRFPGDTGRFLGKYADLLWVPLLLLAFRTASARSWALRALAASFIIVLVLSYAVHAGWVPPTARIHGYPGNAAVFKKDLTHNFLMAYAAFLFLQLGWAARAPRIRWAWIAAAVLATIDVMLMVRGRTGQLVLFALILYSGYAWRGWRGFAITVVALGAIAAALIMTPGPFQARLDRTFKEAREWRDESSARDPVSARLDYYRNSVRIIAEHPLGVGTGGFPKAYEEVIRGTQSPPSVNPHNEYLLITVQIGIVGLIALLWLFYTQWKLAPALPTAQETHLARGLVIAFAIGCIFNSLLLDHTEGLFFAWLTALLYGGLLVTRPSDTPPLR